jgi:O-antigen ligase
VLLWTIPPAVIVALLGLDQFAGWFGTLDWLNVSAPTARLRMTSTVGNPGDLASMLVLPILIAVSRFAAPGALARAGRERMMLGAALAIMLLTTVLTATIASIAAIGVGAAVWWLMRYAASTHASASPSVSVGRQRAWLLPVALVGVIAMLAAGAVAISAPLRVRVIEKTTQLAHGDLNAVLTGRLDGWRAAWAMLRHAPATGVGQGAFRAEFADTRLALEAQGVSFYAQQIQTLMATPHNEALSVAAEQGVPGLLALAWAVWCVGAAAARRGATRDDASLAPASKAMRDASLGATVTMGDDTLRKRATPSPGSAGDAAQPLAWGGLAALAVLSIVSFPLHVPAVAWPWLLFLAWVFRQADEVTA